MTTVYPQTTKETNIKNKRTKNKKYIKVPLKIGLQYFFIFLNSAPIGPYHQKSQGLCDIFCIIRTIHIYKQL
jgi:hypothetical protein